MIFQLKCSIEKVATLANNCLSILLHTQDISTYSPEELSQIFKLKEKDSWVAFKEMEVEEKDIEVKEVDLNQVSKHKRLYNVILAYKKNKEGSFDGAKELYDKTMDNVTDQFLDKLKEFSN
jgi:hypothetical protein